MSTVRWRNFENSILQMHLACNALDALAPEGSSTHTTNYNAEQMADFLTKELPKLLLQQKTTLKNFLSRQEAAKEIDDASLAILAKQEKNLILLAKELATTVRLIVNSTELVNDRKFKQQRSTYVATQRQYLNISTQLAKDCMIL